MLSQTQTFSVAIHQTKKKTFSYDESSRFTDFIGCDAENTEEEEKKKQTTVLSVRVDLCESQ